jgi:hypothetical protein
MGQKSEMPSLLGILSMVLELTDEAKAVAL